MCTAPESRVMPKARDRATYLKQADLYGRRELQQPRPYAAGGRLTPGGTVDPPQRLQPVVMILSAWQPLPKLHQQSGALCSLSCAVLAGCLDCNRQQRLWGAPLCPAFLATPASSAECTCQKAAKALAYKILSVQATTSLAATMAFEMLHGDSHNRQRSLQMPSKAQ